MLGVRLRTFTVSLVLLPLTLLSQQALAQQHTGSVAGTVRTSAGVAIPGVDIVVDATGRGVHATAEGEFQITGMTPGKHSLTARAIGYTPVTQQIEVYSDRTTRLEIVLTKGTVSLGAIRVLGVRAYAASTSNTGLKQDARIMDIPQAVTTISEEFMQDQAARSLDDLLRNVAGLSPFSDYQDFTARGFRSGEDEVTYNGVRSNGNNFFSTPKMNNVERVEVIKGPASVLYGALEGGAMINLVTKTPKAIPAKLFTFTVGNYQTYSSAADFTGPVAGKENLLYRVNGHYDNAHSYRQFQKTYDWNFAPSLTWRPKTRTTLTFMGEVAVEQRNGQRYRGLVGPLGNLYLVPVSYTSNEPTDYANQKQYTGEIDLEQHFGGDWKFNSTYRYSYSDFVNKYHEPTGITYVAGRGPSMDKRFMVSREFRFQDFSWRNLGTTANVGGTLNTGPLSHRLLFGGDLTFKKRLTSPSDYASPVPALDALDPQYGQGVDLEYYKTLNPVDAPFTRDYRDWGVLAQDVMTVIPQLKFVLATRYNDYYVKTANYRTNAYDEQNRNSTTYKAGAVIEPKSWISLYGNFTQGFKPQTASNDDKGGPFDPLVTEQKEVGLKLGLFNERLIVTSDVYRIDKKNLLVPDPAAATDPTRTGFLAQIGQVRSQGDEIEIVGSITPWWSMTANYANNSTRISRDPRINQIGKGFPNAPRSQGAFWTRYDVRKWRTGIGLGSTYVGQRSTFDTAVLPRYTVFDGALYYDFSNRYKLQLNVKNIADQRYFSGGYMTYQLFPGTPRTVQFTVRAKY